jgi:hypothetical protein
MCRDVVILYSKICLICFSGNIFSGLVNIEEKSVWNFSTKWKLFNAKQKGK